VEKTAGSAWMFLLRADNTVAIWWR